MIDLSCPINWEEPHTAGLKMWIKSLPGLRGRWAPDLVQLSGGRGGPRPALQGGVTWTGPQGRRGGLGALGFPALAGQGVTVAHTPALDVAGANASMTLLCWLRTAIVPADSTAVVHQGSGSSGRAFQFFLQFNRVRFQHYDGVNNPRVDLVNYAQVFDDTWHMLGGVRDVAAQQMRFFLDGVDASDIPNNVAFDVDFTATGPLSLGDLRLGTALVYDGLLDDVLLYNRALSAAEIAAGFHLTQRRDTPMLQHLRPRVYSLPLPPAPPPPTAGVPATHRQAFQVTTRHQQTFDVTRRHQQRFEREG